MTAILSSTRIVMGQRMRRILMLMRFEVGAIDRASGFCCHHPPPQADHSHVIMVIRNGGCQVRRVVDSSEHGVVMGSF